MKYNSFFPRSCGEGCLRSRRGVGFTLDSSLFMTSLDDQKVAEPFAKDSLEQTALPQTNKSITAAEISASLSLAKETVISEKQIRTREGKLC